MTKTQKFDTIATKTKTLLDQKTFVSGVASLLALPRKETDRAIQVSEGLSDEDREGFLRELSELNTKLVESHMREGEALTQVDGVLNNAEHAFKAAERSNKEKQSHTKEVSDVERKLSSDQ